MNSLFADNHARGTVPLTEARSGLAIGLVLAGAMLTLPVFVLAGELMISLGPATGGGALATGTLAVAALAAATGSIGAKTRLSTYSILRGPFGARGARLPTVAAALAATGWFAVTTGFFGAAASASVKEVFGVGAPVWLATSAGGALMTGTVLFGFRAIALLNAVAVPLLAAVIIWTVFILMGRDDPGALAAAPARGGAIADFGAGVSVVIGALAAAAVGMPDVTRFARRRADAIIAPFIGFAVIAAGLAALAAAPSLSTGAADYAANLIALGVGAPALAVLILATWTTNVVNLYAASLSLGRIFEGRPDWQLTAAAGAAGTGLALAGLADAFIPMLVALGAALPPIAGVYLIAHWRRPAAPEHGPRWRPFAFAAWAAGAAAALAASFGPLVLTGAPALDGLLVAALAAGLLSRPGGVGFGSGGFGRGGPGVGNP